MAAEDPSPTLTQEQTSALFNILTHFETYDEIESLKDPKTISNYGYPFNNPAGNTPSPPSKNGRSSSPAGSTKSSNSGKSWKSALSSGKDSTASRPAQITASDASVAESPILQSIFKRVPLTLPGVREIPPEFWSDRLQVLIKKFAEADLSESYDKGAMGTRKTLATAFSVMMETLARGLFGGCPTSTTGGRSDKYDLKKAEDLEKSFADAMHEFVYGKLIDDLAGYLARSEDLDAHSPMIEAVIEYEIIHLASFCHHVFVLSSEGPYLVKLIESFHSMIPYAVVRQTLRMSNAATMISAMLRLFLSKLSLGSISNYIGITRNADDGMNLLQRIISVILGWDSAEFKKTTDRIEKDADGPSKEALASLKEHMRKTPKERATIREESKKSSKSIVAVILDGTDPELAKSLSEEQHTKCQEYLAALLSIRDRDEIIGVVCKSSPDLFTQSLRDLVAGFEPYIRAIHDKVDLREHITDFQTFLDQFIAVSKGKKVVGGEADKKAGPDRYSPPSVEDYANLLRQNKSKLYKWLHYGAKSAPDVTDTFKAWADEAIVHFRKPEVPVKGSSSHVEGRMMGQLADLFSELPDDKKKEILPAIDAHAAYLDAVAQLSRSRIQDIVSGDSQTMAGPGIFLMMWQSLLDNTLITPSTAGGSVRRGRDVGDAAAEGKPGASSEDGWVGGSQIRQEAAQGLPEAPDGSAVIAALGEAFRKTIATTEGTDDGRSDASID
ncbi:PX-associated-domain-containing protein [Plectosphaerella plurivora]|uniref:PX-associated-domain-containing protein n=1 Tax=Plectosphaerella plurivora TaxID=936078 RepID=A0A9P8V5V5_9PEZI|nr:PX-associated-domain-containing protein [Plectosphaerella plurivora]